MITSFKKNLSLLLLGLTCVGKSRLGNKLSGEKEFEEGSSTKRIQKVLNKFNVEIIDTPGFDDFDNENKFASLKQEIKNNKPNIIAFVQKLSEMRFDSKSKNIIEEICKMFGTKSIWNNFIIVFTFSRSIKKEKGEKMAKGFVEIILKVIGEYYQNLKVNDNLPIPTKLNYYFVELGDDDEDELDQETINTLTNIIKITSDTPPISISNEKFIVEIKIKRNCEEIIRRYNRYNNGQNIIGRSNLNNNGIGIIGIGALVAANIFNMSTTGITSLITGYEVDKHHLNEDYITFDEESYIYSDGTTEVKKTNVKKLTRIIPK